MTPAPSTRPKTGLLLQAILLAGLIACFTLPGAFIVAGCGPISATTDTTTTTDEQEKKVEELTVGKTDEEKKQVLKNLTEEQKQNLGLNPDQLNQLNQLQRQQTGGTDPLGGVGGGGTPVIPPGGPIPPVGPGPLPGVP